MIPQTFPSKAAGSDGGAVMQAKFLTSVTGLVRWTDYIPVKLKTGGVQDSTDNNGFISIEQAVLTASSKAFVDYYPVYVDNAATKAWECSADGYIPYAPHNTAGCSLVLDFTNGASLDSRVTFTRTTGASNPATYVNNSGVITAATNNQPRFDYDPVTLACKGLLIEESRANLLTYSNGFENTTPWPQTNVTVSSAAATSPDGTNNACKIEETSANGTHGLVTASISFTQNVANTFSVYAKKGERNIITLAVAGVSGVSFNLDTGTAGNTFTNANWSTPTYSITDCGNGFYRCTATFTRLATTTSTTVYLNLSNNASTLPTAIDSYVGTTGYGVYVYGAQLEAGAFATSYIPTTTTALTRNADVATMTGTNFSDWFNASEGTFVVSAQQPSESSVILMASDGTNNNRYSILRDGGNTNSYYVSVGGVNQAALTNGISVPAAGTVTKYAIAYQTNSFAFSRNASTPLTDLSGTLPTVDRLNIGGSPALANFQINGCVSKVFYYPQRLNDSETQAISK